MSRPIIASLEVPPYCRRLRRRALTIYIAAQVVLLAAGTLLGLSGTGTTGSTFRLWFPMVPVPVGAIVYLVLMYRSSRALKTRAAAADYSLCPECAYSLQGAGADAACTCPECGASVDVAHSRKLWHRFATSGW